MDELVLKKCQDIIYITDRLKKDIDGFKEDIPMCVKGDILDAYIDVMDLVESKTSDIAAELDGIRDFLVHCL